MAYIISSRSRVLGHRAPLLWIVLPFAAGVITARVTDIASPAPLIALAAAGAVGAWGACWRAEAWWPIAASVAGFAAGAASYVLGRARLSEWDALPPREARLSLAVERVFAPRDPEQSSGIARVTQAAPPLRKLAGQQVYFSCRINPEDGPPRRSAIMTAAGVLAPLPANPPPDTFDGYLASAGVNFRLRRGRFEAIERPQLAYYRFCDRAAERFRVILGVGIAVKRPRLAGLLRAMMLGETRELTEDQHTIFMQSGTMHLFAISGMNIGVISTAMEALLALLRARPWLRFIIATPLLWLFVDITGAAPSAVRAFAMALFFHGAFVLRRPANPLAAIVASAAIVLVIAPLQLFSASFLMSYGIVVALLVMGLPLSETWQAAWVPWRDLPEVTWTRTQRAVDCARRALLLALAIGVATTLVGWITGVHFFRLLTPGALLANLILIPAASLVTLGGFGALVCGLVGFTGGAALCNHAAALVLLLIEALVRFSVTLPGAFIPAHFKSPWVAGTALGLLMAALFWGYGTGWRRARGGWWPPFAIVAATLAFGVHYGA